MNSNLINDWKYKLDKRKTLLEKGTVHLTAWKEFMKELFKDNISIKEGESSFIFELIGLQFKTILEVTDPSFGQGHLTTYLVHTDINNHKSEEKLLQYWFDDIGNINGIFPQDAYPKYLMEMLNLLDQYISKNAIVLK